MTQDEFVTRYKHQLWGLMLDVSRTGSTGSERSMHEDQIMAKITGCLKAIYVELSVKEPVKNGQPRTNVPVK